MLREQLFAFLLVLCFHVLKVDVDLLVKNIILCADLLWRLLRVHGSFGIQGLKDVPCLPNML